MHLKRVEDVNQIKRLFLRASEESHRNAKNYKRLDRIEKFTDFYILMDDYGLAEAFAGSYQFSDTLVRVLDSTYYFPNRRIRGGNYFGTASEYFLPVMTERALSRGMTPFFSIQSDRPHRRSMKRIVENFNKKNESQYRVLDGYYWTCPSEPKKDNKRCWQTVAICGPDPTLLHYLEHQR